MPTFLYLCQQGVVNLFSLRILEVIILIILNSFFDKVTFVCDTFFSSEELQKVQISEKAVWKFHALTSSKYFCYYLLIFLGS